MQVLVLMMAVWTDDNRTKKLATVLNRFEISRYKNETLNRNVCAVKYYYRQHV